MSEFSVVRRCYSCGAILQSDDPHAPGYIEKKNVEGTPISAPLFCESCWKSTRYNLSPKKVAASEDFLTMLKDAQASDAMIVYVVDLFSFETSFIPEANEILQGLNILVLANKRDLLPRKADDEALKDYVAHRFRKECLNVRSENVELVSLQFASDVKAIAERIERERRGHDVYVIGASSSGKSVFANAFLRTYKNPSSRSIASAVYPGTSLRVLTIPLDSSSSLYDTPGTSIDNSMVTHVDTVAAFALLPREEVKARNFTLSPGEGLFFDDHLARIDMLEGPKTKMSVYASKEVSLRKEKAGDAEQTIMKLLRQFGKTDESRLPFSAKDADAFDLKVEENEQRDIGIEGLGWVSFLGNGQSFRIYVRKGVALYTSRAKIAKLD